MVLLYCFWFIYITILCEISIFFFFSSRRRHTRLTCDWSSDVCSSAYDTMAADYAEHFSAEHPSPYHLGWWVEVDEAQGEGQGEHVAGDVPVPGSPLADLVLVQAD